MLLINAPYLQSWNGILQTVEAVLDVVSPLPLESVVVGSLVAVGEVGQVLCLLILKFTSQYLRVMSSS